MKPGELIARTSILSVWAALDGGPLRYGWSGSYDRAEGSLS